jgi:hypothetical protein
VEHGKESHCHGTRGRQQPDLITWKQNRSTGVDLVSIRTRCRICLGRHSGTARARRWPPVSSAVCHAYVLLARTPRSIASAKRAVPGYARHYKIGGTPPPQLTTTRARRPRRRSHLAGRRMHLSGARRAPCIRGTRLPLPLTSLCFILCSVRRLLTEFPFGQDTFSLSPSLLGVLCTCSVHARRDCPYAVGLN